MKLAMPRVFVSLLAVAFASLVSDARGAAVPVKVELSALRAIQVNTMEKTADGKFGDDDVYVIAIGTAKGEDVQKRVPESGTLKANPKKQAISDKEPAALWEGSLDDGEFAFLTVVVFQGQGADEAKLKAFQEQLSAAGKEERSKKTITGDDAKALSANTLKAQQEIIKNIKNTFSRENKTDHFGGLFNVLVWNNNGQIAKRLDPVGLTFGEHDGTDPKIYTKLKLTRNNVFEQDPENNEWYETAYRPLNDDEDAVRVKMLETEYIKTGDDDLTKKVTDYLADVKVYAGGEAQKWTLGEQRTGKSDIHHFWELAE